jgi:hypothetical protein
MRVIDQPFPAHSGPGFFKIGPHDHTDGFFDLFSRTIQFLGISQSRFLIVNGTRARDDQKPLIFFPENLFNLVAAFSNCLSSLLGHRQFCLQCARGNQGNKSFYMQVICLHDYFSFSGKNKKAARRVFLSPRPLYTKKAAGFVCLRLYLLYQVLMIRAPQADV